MYNNNNYYQNILSFWQGVGGERLFLHVGGRWTLKNGSGRCEVETSATHTLKFLYRFVHFLLSRNLLMKTCMRLCLIQMMIQAWFVTYLMFGLTKHTIV